VLSRPETRQEYDARLAIEAAKADAELRALLENPASTAARKVQAVPAELVTAVTQLAA
jgi:hypothetical protein